MNRDIQPEVLEAIFEEALEERKNNGCRRQRKSMATNVPSQAEHDRRKANADRRALSQSHNRNTH